MSVCGRAGSVPTMPNGLRLAAGRRRSTVDPG